LILKVKSAKKVQ